MYICTKTLIYKTLKTKEFQNGLLKFYNFYETTQTLKYFIIGRIN